MDLKKYKITNEPVNDDGVTNDYINNLTEKLYYDVQDNPKKQIKKLKALIEKYPNVPAFKNYLMVAYKMTGDKERTLKVIKIINEQHPDYFFGKTSLAEYYLDKGEYEKVPEILGSVKDISEIYPEKDIFHISEVANFHHFVAKYYFEKERVKDENFQYHYDTLISIHEELYGTSENKYTNSLDMFCLSKKMEARIENLKKEQEKTVSVKADEYNEEIQTKEKPKFNHPETENLYCFGFDIELEFLKKPLHYRENH
ncbi:MAG: hypothetical protein K8R54_19190 [Bacteroidales bacterium]|nr:hypothetical protein [Bacteroidales bacterium]